MATAPSAHAVTHTKNLEAKTSWQRCEVGGGECLSEGGQGGEEGGPQPRLGGWAAEEVLQQLLGGGTCWQEWGLE
jgi:hypothetical protein